MYAKQWVLTKDKQQVLEFLGEHSNANVVLKKAAFILK